MKNPLSVAFLALALSLVGFGATLMNAPADGSRVESASVAASPDAGLLARVETLSEENRELRERLALLELRPAETPSQRVPIMEGFVSMEQFEAFRDEVRTALATRGALAGDASMSPELVASPEFKEQIADTLSVIRHEEAVEKVRAYQEQRLARLDEVMPKIEEWLELTPHQSNEMRSALLAQYEREAEIVRRWEEGEDPELLGELKLSDRETHRAELSAFLTAEQLETYLSRGGGSGK